MFTKGHTSKQRMPIIKRGHIMEFEPDTFLWTA